MGDNVLDKDKKLGSLYHLKVCALQQHREKKKQQRERIHNALFLEGYVNANDVKIAPSKVMGCRSLQIGSERDERENYIHSPPTILSQVLVFFGGLGPIV
ncbi:hypothetical protein OUZ56_008252 [Daphnia magna]|uniref:Uncharacterized protein n=1 Tax=Daphnia magna TaxID=35525 RepID=A0ABR0ACE7_9CRUS|nr:hypothetical protein OUZ56_008252 [Daphnia magna]